METPDKPHQFDRASQFLNAYSLLVCKTPKLQEVAKAFVRNMNRVRGIAALPVNLTAIAMINEAAWAEALAKREISFHDPRVIYDNSRFDPALYAEINAERQRLLTDWEKSLGKRAFEARIMSAGIFGMNLIIDLNKEEARVAVQATMAAMLIGLWTAFESLAQDTWIAAVDASPVPLRNVFLSLALI